MQNFQELTHKQLIALTPEQVQAYCDVEVARAGLVKAASLPEVPDYIRSYDALTPPKRDVLVYEIEGWQFVNRETADKFLAAITPFLSDRVTTDYDYNVGHDFRYVNDDREFPSVAISTKMAYSKTLFFQIREKLKSIEQFKEKKTKEDADRTNSVIDFEKAEAVEREIKDKVYKAWKVENQSVSIAAGYDKYFAINQEKQKTIDTLFAVYGVVDEELRNLILEKLQDK